MNRVFPNPSSKEASQSNKFGQEVVERFPEDQRLRNFNFTVEARPKNGESLWRKRGDNHLYTQSKALAEVDSMIKELEVKNRG